MNRNSERGSRNNKLAETVEYCYRNSPFYARNSILKSYLDGTTPFEQLPLTTKADLAAKNDSFRCVPLSEVREYVATSGTTGNPVTSFLTENDLRRLAHNEAESFRVAGCSASDIFQLLTTVDKQFMAGLAYVQGARELGAGMIRIGPGVPQLQWRSIQQYEPTVLIAVPSFILRLLEFARANGILPAKSSVRKIICIGEPVRNPDFSLNALGKRITDQWNVDLFSTYASTEMATAYTECEFGNGCHENPQLIFTEVLNEAGEQVANGEYGEVVVTTLGIEGMPLIRFQTGDIAHFYDEPCSCGRTSIRLGPITGRKNQMIKLKGTTLYPKAITDILDSLEGLGLYQIQVRKNQYQGDDVQIVFDSGTEMNHPADQLIALFRGSIRVVPTIAFMDEEQLRKLVFRDDKRKPEKIVFL